MCGRTVYRFQSQINKLDTAPTAIRAALALGLMVKDSIGWYQYWPISIPRNTSRYWITGNTPVAVSFEPYLKFKLVLVPEYWSYILWSVWCQWTVCLSVRVFVCLAVFGSVYLSMCLLVFLGGCDNTLKLHSQERLMPMVRGEISEETYDYDLIVIGGGSGGLAAAKVLRLCFTLHLI